MKRIQLTLKLIDPIVISQSSATEGLHKTLDYIPGANLLGAVASQQYKKLKDSHQANVNDQPALSEVLFHSGQVRFGNAYPMHQDQIALPIPLSLHHAKGEPKTRVTNNFFGWEQEGKQPKQHRTGYITSSLIHLKPKKDLHLRTAIEKGKGTAAEGQIYTYQSIQAGLTYQANIDCDTDALAETVIQFFKEGQTLRFGRSKTAHYGRTKIESIKQVDLNTPSIYQDDNYFVLWLASDLIAYSSKTGQPTLTPSLEDLGLVELDSENPGNLIAKKSYIRTRQYSPYNGHRRSYDLQKQVICQGSILVYPKANINADVLKTGLGFYTESGHGQVVSIDEDWKKVFQQNLELQKIEEPNKDSNENFKLETPLAKLLQSRHQDISGKEMLQKEVNKYIKEFAELYRSIRRYNGIALGTDVGPSNTQWSRIRELATKVQFQDKAQLSAGLFCGSLIDKKKNAQSTAIIKFGDDAWTLSDDRHNFASKLKDIFNKFKDEPNLNLLMRMLAKEATHSPIIQAARKGAK